MVYVIRAATVIVDSLKAANHHFKKLHPMTFRSVTIKPVAP